MVYPIEVLDRWRRRTTVEVIIRLDTVEVRCRDTMAGVVDRDLLRDWLSDPAGVYAYDEMAWLAAGNGVALAIDDMVPAWVLADHQLTGLKEHV